MSATTEKKSWWDSMTEHYEEAVTLCKESAKVAWEIVKDNPVESVLFAGCGAALVNKAWLAAAVCGTLGTLGIALDQFNKKVVGDMIVHQWKTGLTDDAKIVVLQTALKESCPDLSKEKAAELASIIDKGLADKK